MVLITRPSPFDTRILRNMCLCMGYAQLCASLKASRKSIFLTWHVTLLCTKFGLRTFFPNTHSKIGGLYELYSLCHWSYGPITPNRSMHVQSCISWRKFGMGHLTCTNEYCRKGNNSPAIYLWWNRILWVFHFFWEIKNAVKVKGTW